MMNKYSEKMTALNHVNSLSLAALDTALFLDTHPDNEEAFESFRRYNAMSNQAKQEYSKKFGPLTWAQSGEGNCWEWANQPWPWEGGNC